MKVPSSLLPHRVALRPYRGTSGTAGPVYGPQRTVKARVEGRRRAVRTSTGIGVISTATAIVRPDESIPVQSRLIHDGRTFEVLQNNAGEGLRQTAYRELILEGPL